MYYIVLVCTTHYAFSKFNYVFIFYIVYIFNVFDVDLFPNKDNKEINK